MSDPTAPAPSSGSAPDGVPVRAVELQKSYPYGESERLHVLRGVDMTVASAEAVAVVGASGAGKSTLLHLLGALDRPTAGEVRLGGRSVADLDDRELAGLRNRHVGFVFQFHHLLREFTALENVMMPRLIAGASHDEAAERARDLLDSVGLSARLDHKPWQLSGGEQQRVAVARALSNEPLVLLADEPSGNLDHQTSERLHDTLFELREDRSLAMVLVTHNRGLAERADRILRLEDGYLTAEGRGGTGVSEAREEGSGKEPPDGRGVLSDAGKPHREQSLRQVREEMDDEV